MQRAEIHWLDEATTPVLVCGTLSGLAGAAVGIVPTAIVSLFQGRGLTEPLKLVAALLMGTDALERSNALSAPLLGVLITMVAGGVAGALFTWLRRYQARFKLLVAEGIGFGLVLFAMLRITARVVHPLMRERQSMIALGVAYAMFGATLSLELLLRVGSLRVDPDELRKNTSELARP